MRKLLSIVVILLFSAAMAFAQSDRTMIIRGDQFQSAGAPGLELFFSDDHQTVKNIPLTADLVNTHVQYLQDGNKITNEETSHFYRDSEGRTRRENKLMLSGHEGDAPSMISINDPVAHNHFVLNTVRKSADQVVVEDGSAKSKVMFFKRQDEAAALSKGPVPDDQPETKEDLGTQTIEGVSAHGTRMSHTIPAGKIGNERAITVTTESWYSDELGLEVLRTHKDPWVGEMTTKVTNVRRGEPDASLFTPPTDYKVQNLKGGQRIIRLETKDGEQLPPPPPAPPQD